VLYSTDCAICDAAFDQGSCFRVHAYAAGAVDHAVADDGLGVDGEWRRGFVGFDGGAGGHCGEAGLGNG